MAPSPIKRGDLYLGQPTALNQFFATNRILPSSKAFLAFLSSSEEYSPEGKRQILSEVLQCLKTVTTNAYVLGQAEDERGSTVPVLLINLLEASCDQPAMATLISDALQLILVYSELKESYLEDAACNIVRSFHNNLVNHRELFVLTQAYKCFLMARLEAQKDPKKVLIFHGQQGIQLLPGIRINPGEQLTWPFTNGMTFCCWINLEAVKTAVEWPCSRLFTFYCQGQGGFECYLVDSKLYYRTLGEKYSEPTVGSNGILLAELETNKWNFICIEHEPSKKLAKSKLTFWLNKNKPAISSLDPPKIGPQSKCKLVLCHRLYGRTSSLCYFRSATGTTACQDLNKNINSLENYRNPKALVFQQKNGMLYERGGTAFSPVPLLDRCQRSDFKNVLPLFYCLSFLRDAGPFSPADRMLELLMLSLRYSHSAQLVAVNQEHFKIIACLISEVPFDCFTQRTIEVILQIKHTITNSTLLEQYYSDFLWGVMRSKLSFPRKQEILEYLKNCFSSNAGLQSSYIGLDELINILVYLDPRTASCCEKHRNFVVSHNFIDASETHRPCQLILFQIVEQYLLSPHINLANELFKICRLLTARLSPCLTFELCGLILRMLSLRSPERNAEAESKRVMKHFRNQKAVSIFLYLLENTVFTELRAECIRIAYLLVLRKGSHLKEAEVAAMISRTICSRKKELLLSPRAESYENLYISQNVAPAAINNQPPSEPETSSTKNLGDLVLRKGVSSPHFSQAGPKPPPLTNRTKGKNRFNFDFASTLPVRDDDDSKPKNSSIQNFDKISSSTAPKFFDGKQADVSTIVSNKDKTNNSSTVSSQPASADESPLFRSNKAKSTEAKFKKMALTIDTASINEMYTFGGQKGQQVQVSEAEQQQELRRIKQLTAKCILAMQNSRNAQRQKSAQSDSLTKNNLFNPFSAPQPPPSTQNKTDLSKTDLPTTKNATGFPKRPKLQLESIIQSPQVQHPSPMASVPVLQSKSSFNSAPPIPEQDFVCMYQALIECCLGLTGGETANLIVTSSLSLLLEFACQIGFGRRVLVDLEMLFENPANLAVAIETPELYEFLLESIYQCILIEINLGNCEYRSNLEKVFKTAYLHIFRQDAGGDQKFQFLVPWLLSKKKTADPLALLLTSRCATLWLLQTIEHHLMINTSNDLVMEGNFQATANLIDSVRRLFIGNGRVCTTDSFGRCILMKEAELPNSLKELFESQWIDQVVYKKYLFAFRRYFSSDWFGRGSKSHNRLQYIMETPLPILNKEALYFLNHNFAIVLLHMSEFVLAASYDQKSTSKSSLQDTVWFCVVLTVLSDHYPARTNNFKHEVILSFVECCRMLSESDPDSLAEIVDCVIRLHSIPTDNAKQPIATNKIIEELFSKYIPPQSHTTSCKQLPSFVLGSFYRRVWMPEGRNYNNAHSSTYIKLLERQKTKVSANEDVVPLVQAEKTRDSWTEALVNCSVRLAKNSFRKIWYGLRVFGQIWQHPDFQWQNDALFNKLSFSYEKFQKNPVFKYKIAKQQSKGRARYFLKPKLIEPAMVESRNIPEPNRDESILHQALMRLETELSISSHRFRWLFGKEPPTEQTVMAFRQVRIVNTLTLRTGYLGIFGDRLVFVGSRILEDPTHLAIEQYLLRGDKCALKMWPLQYIKQLFKRRYINKKKAVQINLIYGKSIFVDFGSQNDADDFLKRLAKLKGTKCPNLVYAAKSFEPKRIYDASNLLKRWSQYELSNFDYLMELNVLGGRCYSDLTQYPVVPWVLINFAEEKLVLSQSQYLRDLHRPMGALGANERADGFMERYEMMTFDEPGFKKFHYGTHYSSPGIIYHYLLRLSPYTQGGVLLQSGKFDFADRLFYSISNSYQNATSEYSDVRQLVPELYTLPEVYLNINGLNLGVMQNKKHVHNLELPPWAHENPYFYVAKLRSAMEQPEVSQNIHGWIDLIFGFKQKGPEAIRSLNCFYYLTYEDNIDWSDAQVQPNIKAIESQIVNFGQTPSQIFTRVHQQRPQISDVQRFRTICDVASELKVYRPTRNNNKMNGSHVPNPMHQMDQSVIFMKWVKEGRLMLIRRSGEVITYRWQPGSQSTKGLFQCALERERKLNLRPLEFDPAYYFDPSLNVKSFPIELIGGGTLACIGGLNESKLQLVDVDSGQMVDSYIMHEATVTVIKADAKENFLLTGDAKGTVIVWRVMPIHNSYKLGCYGIFTNHRKQVTGICINYQLRCFATCSAEGSVFVYNLITGKRLRVFWHPRRLPIDQVIISTCPLASIAMFCSQEAMILCYSINGQLIQRLHEKDMYHFMSPILVRNSNGFEFVAYGNEKGDTIVRSFPFLDKPKKLSVAKEACANRVCVSKDGRYLITACSDGEISVITDPSIIQ